MDDQTDGNHGKRPARLNLSKTGSKRGIKGFPGPFWQDEALFCGFDGFSDAVAVITGLAAILLAEPVVRTILLFLSAAYLGYLAFRIALAGSKISFIEMIKAPGFMTGMTLQFINPKAYAVHTTFFTGFAFYPDSFTIEISLKFLIMNFIWIILHLAWLYAGCKIHELNLSSSAQKWVNLLMAASLCGIVVLSIGSI